MGFIFGPAIGGILSHFGPAAPMWAAAALCAANLSAAWFLLPESRRATAETRTLGRMEAFRHAMTKPTLLLVLALYFIVTMAFSGFEATFALFSEARFGYTATSIGFLFAFIGVVLALIQGVLVGRATLGAPWFFRRKELVREWAVEQAGGEAGPAGDPIDEPDVRERFTVMLDHARQFERLGGPDQFQRMRKHLGWYCKGFPHAAAMRARMFRASSVRDVEETMTEFFGCDFMISLTEQSCSAGHPA